MDLNHGDIELRVPNRAVRYVLLQRTGIQRWNPKRRRWGHLVPIPYGSGPVFVESILRRRAVKKAFSRNVADDFVDIAPHLPSDVGAVLDIGCGMAGIDALLYRYYQRRPDVRYFLLDRTGISAAAFAYGMGAADRFYSSLDTARSLLIANGMQAEQISVLEAEPDLVLSLDPPPDLVISLLSWGFHYPLGTYLNEVIRALSPGGRLIVDIRRGSGGDDELRASFPKVEVIAETPKQLRCLAVAEA